jgi:phosphoglycerate kinase
LRKIQEANTKNKKVLVRVDYNVPIKDGKVVNDERIRASVETINFLLKQKASVILCSHLGRPEGQVAAKYSLKPTVKVLEKLIKKSVQFSPSAVGKDKDKMVENLKEGEVLLLENLRFYPGEEKNLRGFAENLARGADLYVNDAFSASHREHASIDKVTDILKAYAGFSLQDEVESLSKLTDKPKRPFVLIQGGAKISDKLELVRSLLSKVDVLILGGAVANTVLMAKGEDIGASIAEPEAVDTVKAILTEAEKKNVEVLMPVDVIVGKKLDDKKGVVKKLNEVKYNEFILDIGPETAKLYGEPLDFAETIFWNGPMGYAENKAFAGGTEKIARDIVSKHGYSVIGGGDTIASLDDKLKSQFDFVSMAGGASLEYLSGKKLPGLKALENSFSLLTIFRI